MGTARNKPDCELARVDERRAYANENQMYQPVVEAARAALSPVARRPLQRDFPGVNINPSRTPQSLNNQFLVQLDRVRQPDEPTRRRDSDGRFRWEGDVQGLDRVRKYFQRSDSKTHTAEVRLSPAGLKR